MAELRAMVTAPGVDWDDVKLRVDELDAIVEYASHILEGVHPSRFEGYVQGERYNLAHREYQYDVIWLTPHSYLVDEFDADEVAVYDGESVAALSDHPEWSKWRETMDPGEFWSFVGEDWVGDVESDEDWIRDLEEVL